MEDKRLSFYDWCADDPDDERKINYVCDFGDRVEEFTSEDIKPLWIMEWLRQDAMVDSVQLIDDEWYVELSERK